MLIEIAVLAGMCLAVAPIDYAEHPLWALALTLRLGFLLPVQILAFRSAFRTADSRVLDASAALSLCSAMGIITILACLAEGETTTRYVTVQGGLILVYSALTGQRFRIALISVGLVLAAYDAAILLVIAPKTQGMLAYVNFVTVFSLGLLGVRLFVFERSERLHFLNRQLQICLNRDLTRLTRELAILASTDALTGVSNRRAHEEYLEHAWADAGQRGQWIGLALIDIDHFKQFNDAAGHEAGDHGLVAVARALQESLPPEGRVARYGGEEFVVVVRGADPEAVLDLGERLRMAVEACGLMNPGADGRAVTVSIGVTSVIPSSLARKQDALRAADHALYESKRTGRNRVTAQALLPNAARHHDTEGRRVA
ncbi:hypothetical protein ASF53_23255 [Methylobacterium sp. Leaf123]|nr:hypothetical protein ASF53_23255 [Methylobacterium sp. Leaf123]